MNRRWLPLFLLLGLAVPLYAQMINPVYEVKRREGAREFIGQVREGQPALVYALGLQVGDVIYAFASSPDTDPALYVLDKNFEFSYAYDDNSGGGLNAALAYTITERGDYVIAMLPNDERAGSFRVVVGINTPHLVEGVPFFDAVASRGDFDCARVEILNERPVLSGRVERIETPNFVIHYTRSGADAVDPILITELEHVLERALDVQLNDLGWYMPPGDCGLGGDDRMDVYVLDLEEGNLGLAMVDGIVGDNPHSPAAEINASFGHLQLDHTMEFDDPQAALDTLRVVAAHEIHHLIQFGYDYNDSYYGIYEAGATWVQQLVYPDLSLDFLTTEWVLAFPNVCIGGMVTGFTVRIYGEWTLVDSLAQDYGPRVYQGLWEHLAVDEGMLGFYNGLAALGTSAEEVIVRMTIRNLLRDYEQAWRITDPITLAGRVEQGGEYTPQDEGVQQLGVAVLELVHPDVYSLELGPGQMRLYVVGIRDDQTAELFSLGNFGTVDLTSFAHAYAIIVNSERHQHFEDCAYTDWRLQVFTGGRDARTLSTGEIWDASRFRKP